jgi:hypothetical protein
VAAVGPDFLSGLKREELSVPSLSDSRIEDRPHDVLALDGLSDAIRAHRDLLVWAVVGRASRHAWVPCDECGHAVLLDPAPRWAGRLAWPHCYLTPGCSGRHLSVPSTGALSVGEVHRTVGERRPITDATAWFAAVSFVMGSVAWRTNSRMRPMEGGR